jgi:glycosyltransferase involved in cell wall biosynthesis
MADDVLVSIVMPAHNSEKYVGAAIESVLNQTQRDWELIVVDDASNDGTSNLVSEFSARDSRIQVYRFERSVGPARARNLAIQHATGRYIAFLDSDDVWLPNKLEHQLRKMQESGAVLSFTAYKKVDADGQVGKTTIGVPSTVTYSDLLRTNVIGCLTAVYDTQALGKMYMPEDARREDYRLWLQILKLRTHHEDYALWLAILRRMFRDRGSVARKTVIGINEVLAYYRIHSRSVSRNKLRAAAMQWAVYRQVEKLSLLKSIYYFAHYAYHGYKKARLR